MLSTIGLFNCLFLVAGFTSTQAKSKCNPSCVTTSYSLSPDLRVNADCTKLNGCLVQSEVSVIERDHFDEYLNFTLIGYNIGESEVRTIGLQLAKSTPITAQSSSSSVTFPGPILLYSCNKLRSGLTSAKITIDTLSRSIGSSIYLNGNLYCTWIASKNNIIWPNYGDKPADLVEDANYQISLQVNESSVLVATQSEQLPIYHRQYLKCCQYKIRGNDNYQLISKRSDDKALDFMLQVIGSSPNVVQIVLKNPSNVGLMVECSFSDSSINFYATINKQLVTLTNILVRKKIYDNRCSWTLPGLVNVSSDRPPIDTEKTTFKTMQIIADRMIVYNETNFNLSGFANLIVSNGIIILMSIVFTLSLG